MNTVEYSEVFELLTTLVRSLVDRPESVEILQMPDAAAGVLFRVGVHPSDIGKLIGKNGQTARALRVILNANAARLQQSFKLDIVEGGGAAAPAITFDP